MNHSASLRDALRLIVIVDRRMAGERWLSVIEAALQTGATAIQLRDKEATSAEVFAMAHQLQPLCQQHGAPLLVNDRFDIALAAGAHGVHLGDGDLPVAAVRGVVPRDFLIGRSADTEEDARSAEADGASYLGVGSVFGTQTKKEVIGEMIGTEQLARVARSVSIPVVGIGGVTTLNAGQCIAAGAVGVAVVSAVMKASNPGAAVRDLLASLDRGE